MNVKKLDKAISKKISSVLKYYNYILSSLNKFTELTTDDIKSESYITDNTLISIEVDKGFIQIPLVLFNKMSDLMLVTYMVTYFDKNGNPSMAADNYAKAKFFEAYQNAYNQGIMVSDEDIEYFTPLLINGVFYLDVLLYPDRKNSNYDGNALVVFTISKKEFNQLSSIQLTKKLVAFLKAKDKEYF